MTTHSKKKTRWLTGIVGLSLLLTGCWGSSSSSSTHKPTDNTNTTAPQPSDTSSSKGNNSSNDPSSSTASNNGGSTPKANFPTVIQDAMKQFGNNPPAPLAAPTMIPLAKTGSQAVSTHTWTSSSDTAYHVQLLQTDTPLNANKADMTTAKSLGGFSGNRFGSSDTAQSQVRPLSGYLEVSIPEKMGASGRLSNSMVDLGSGITGQTYLFAADRMSGKSISQYAAITWQEGRWDLEVFANESSTLPVATAKKVVVYLHNNFLPVPQTKGSVFISIQKGGSIETTVAWQKDNTVYSTQSENITIDPVTTALDMVISTHKYQ